jgi:hypothetical protein
MNVTIICTAGTNSHHTVSAFHDIAPLIGAETLDRVNLRDGRVMLVDDDGWESYPLRTAKGISLVPVKPRKPVNPTATALYQAVRRPGVTQQIVDHVVIVLDRDVAYEEDK